jgi:hypothetical protein
MMVLQHSKMGLIEKEQLQRLLSHENELCVTLYLPCPRGYGESNLVPLRLKQLLDQIEEELLAQGWRRPDAEAFLQAARSLPVDERTPFGLEPQEGVALFMAKNYFALYRLPLLFTEEVKIGQRFALRQLIPLLSGDGVFYLLALSENKVSFFRASHFALQEIELANAPHSLAESLRYDEFEKTLQPHSISSGGRGQGRGEVAFHGQGDIKDAAIQRRELTRFLQEVDREAIKVLNEERAPLVVAGVEAIQGLFRAASHYPSIVEEGVLGNVDRMNPPELHQQAWAVVAPLFQQAKTQSLELFGQLHHHSQTTWRQVLQSAFFGQVATLFVPVDATFWGIFDPQSASVSVHKQRQAGDEDLVELALAYTLRFGGMVYALAKEEMPQNAPVAAILRS